MSTFGPDFSCWRFGHFIQKEYRMVPRPLLLSIAITAVSIQAASIQAAAANAAEPRIAWYGTLKDGLAEAKRSSRPILFVSGAPHCQGVSGIW